MSEARPTADVLLNPWARHADRFELHRALRLLEERSVDAILVAPSSPGAFREAARQAVSAGVDFVFVAGGDGAMRLAAAELLHSSTALAPIPVGTANILARETGLPLRWDEAMEAHLSGQRVRMDTGQANGATFLLMAGVGWDAAIASRVTRRLKAKLGAGAYLLQAARTITRLHPRQMQLEVDGRDLASDWGLLVVSNTRLYGGLVEFTPGASAVDGMLDLCAAGPRRIGQGTALATRLALGRLREQDGLHFDRGREVSIKTPGIPVQVDGDVIGETPMQFTVAPHSLVVSVPAGPLPALLLDEAETGSVDDRSIV